MRLKRERVSEVLKWNEVNLFAELDGREQSKSMNANGMKAKSGWAPRQRGRSKPTTNQSTRQKQASVDLVLLVAEGVACSIQKEIQLISFHSSIKLSFFFSPAPSKTTQTHLSIRSSRFCFRQNYCYNIILLFLS